MELMKRRPRFLAVVAGGVLGLLVVSQSFAAKKPVQVVTGTYLGQAVEDIDPAEPAFDVEFVLENGKNRKLVGTAAAEGDDPVDLKGTISASGQVSLQGKNPEGGNLIIKGEFTVDPLTEERVIEGTYKITKGGEKGTFEIVAPPAP